MNNQSNKYYKEAIEKSCNRIATLKLAIKGLVGNLPEYIIDKLVEISAEISNEQFNIKFSESCIENTEEVANG